MITHLLSHRMQLAPQGIDPFVLPSIQEKLDEGFSKIMSEACRGGGIRGINMVGYHSVISPIGKVIVCKSLRKKFGFKKGERGLVAIYRYPIAAATSVTVMQVIFSDDPEIEDLLKQAGIADKFGRMSYALRINPDDSLELFQADDDLTTNRNIYLK